MKIIAIRLKNLTSIEGVVEVDFTSEPLASAGIFAISGPTGAGKSTLLDALCLALYDKAPRFASSVESVSLADVGENQINQSDVRNLLRRGTGDGYAEVDFIGRDGHRYRSRWSVRRAKFKPTGSLQSQVIEVRDLDTEKEFQGTRKELLAQLTELVGLTYEQFTRTVLLAQNDFATFLKSKGAAKAELLEKLTGTAVYSRISKEIYERNKALQEEVNVIRGRMEAIELMPDEAWELLKKERKEAMAQRERGTIRLNELNVQLNVVRQLKAQQELWTQKVQEEGAEQAKRKGQLETLAQQEEGLARFKQQCEAIQPDLQKARELDVQIASRREDFGRAQQIWQEAANRLKEQRAKWEAAKEGCRRATDALARLLKDTPVEQVEQVESVLLTEEKALQQVVKENEERLERMNAFGYPQLMKEQAACEKELMRLKEMQKRMEQQATTRMEVERLAKEVAACEEQLLKQQGVLETAQRLYEQARMTVGKDVKALRQQLREGEACPVCGSTSHPYAQQVEAIDTLYRQLEQAHETAEATYRQCNNRHIACQRDWMHHQKISEQLAALQLEALKELAASEVMQSWLVSDGATGALLTVLSSEGGSLPLASTEGVVYLEQQLHGRLQELAALIGQYGLLQQAWQLADKRIKDMRFRCESLRANVEVYRVAMGKVTAGSEVMETLLLTEKNEKLRLDEIERTLNVLCQERGTLLKGKSVEAAQQAMERRDKEWQLTLEQVRKEVEATERRLAGLQGEMKHMALSMEELKTQYSKMETPEMLPDWIARQQAENQQTEKWLADMEVRLLQQERNKLALEEVKKEWMVKTGIAERWAKLNKLLGSADGAKFKVIAQSHTLNLLLRHANKHLEYLSKRYKLQQVPGTLALQVIDCDMCDEVRTVYSLSGGESFLISLALALGLSSLSSNNLKVDSLFIDEGFGSLDADSLRTAMEALEQLQMQGRKVGVISHVQEMSERISVQVQVHKKVNGKSVLTVVG